MPKFIGRASALAKTATETVTNCNPLTPGVSPCQTITILPDSYFDIYDTQAGATIRVDLQYTCVTGDEGFRVLGGGAGSIDSGTTDYSNVCAGQPIGHQGNGTIYVDVKTSPSDPGGSPSTYEALLHIQAVNPPSWTGYYGGHVTVQATVSGGTNADIFPGSSLNPGSDPSSGGNWSANTREFGFLSGGTENFDFQVPCNYTASKVYIAWSGADQDSNYQNNSLSWTLSNVNNPSDNAGLPVTASGSMLGTSGSSTVYTWTFTAHPGDHYRWSWKNLSGDNLIGYSLPFSQNSLDENVSCGSWKLEGASQVKDISTDNVYKQNLYVNNKNDSIAFYHTVTNEYGAKASYSWQVEGHCNISGCASGYDNSHDGQNAYSGAAKCGNPLPSGSASNVSAGDSNPGNLDSSATTCYYQFPSTAVPGDTYCQFIAYNNADGPGDTSYNNNQSACVELLAPSYSASCNVTDVSGPNGGPVLAGQPITIHATITNTGGSPLLNNNDLGIWSGTYTGQVGTDGGAGGQYAYDHTQPNNFTSDTDTTDYPYGVDAFSPKFSAGAMGGVPSSDSVIAPGDTVDVNPITVTAPNDIYTVNSIANFGHVGYGTSFGWTSQSVCSLPSFDVYKLVTMTPHASTTVTSGSTEDPQNIQYSTNVNDNDGSTLANDPTYSCFYLEFQATQPSGSSCPAASLAATDWTGGKDYTNPPNPNDVLPSNANSGNYAPTSSQLAAGNNFCSYIWLSWTQAYIGPNNSVYQPSNPTSNTAWNCITINNEPYAHFLGSDVSAGGSFQNLGNCTNAGGIDTYTDDTGFDPGGSGAPPIGSGVQIGALSIGPIYGFSSAQLRGSAPDGSIGLTFANTNNVSGNGPGAPPLGGNLGGTHCQTDYFSRLPANTQPDRATTSLPDISTTKNADGSVNFGQAKYYIPPTGTLSIGGGGIDTATNVAIFVDGNVHITGNITYKSTDWGSIEDIPSMMLVVRGGNIYLDNGVSQLDGIYVAEPDSRGNGGNIYTCINPSSQTEYTPDQLLSNCRSQLLVNGAFVANKVYLDRSYGSLRNSYPGEQLGGTRPPNKPDCGDSGPAPLGDCGAEIFNYTPEVYLTQPPINRSNGYDYITSLSPIL